MKRGYACGGRKRPRRRGEREQRNRHRQLRDPIERDEAGEHQRESEQHGVAAADADANHAGGQRADHAAHGPGDEAERHVFGLHAEALGAVQREPGRERLEDHLQQQRREEHRAHARDIAAHRRPTPRSRACRTSLPLRSPSIARARAATTAKITEMASTVPAAIRKAVRMPSILPSIRNTTAPTHIWNVTEPTRERPIPRRHDVGDQRLERRPLEIDARVEHDDRGDQPPEPESRGAGEQRHADRGHQEALEHERQAAAAAIGGAVGHHAGHRHEQEQQEVVDRHHAADGGAVVTQRVAHEERHERAEQRTGHPGEQAAQADDGEREKWRAPADRDGPGSHFR